MREIAELRFIAAYFFQVERVGRLHLKSFYGAGPEEIGVAGESIAMTENLPFVSCIRDGRLLWSNRITGKKSAGDSRFKSVIAWPVASDYRIIGSFCALAETPFREDPELKECMEALATLIGVAILQNIATNHSNPPSRGVLTPDSNHDEELSERQELILKMISEGRTNGDIADILGYSESLIRQETIRIYATLKCSGRAEAARIYRERSKLIETS